MARTDLGRLAFASIAFGSLTWCTSFSGLPGAPVEDLARPTDAGDGALDGGRRPPVDSGPETDAATALDCKTYEERILADEPVSYFRMEEVDRTVVDETGGAVTCSYASGIALGAEGHLGPCGRAIDLRPVPSGIVDPTMRCTGPYAFGGTTPFGLEMWIVPRKKSDAPQRLISRLETDPARNGYDIFLASGPQGFKAELSMHAANVVECAVTSEPIELDTWTHLFAQYTGTTIELWTNGVKTEAPCRALGVGRVQLSVGGRAEGKGDYFDGRIDDVAIYDHVLTDQRILSHLGR